MSGMYVLSTILCDRCVLWLTKCDFGWLWYFTFLLECMYYAIVWPLCNRLSAKTKLDSVRFGLLWISWVCIFFAILCDHCVPDIQTGKNQTFVFVKRNISWMQVLSAILSYMTVVTRDVTLCGMTDKSENLTIHSFVLLIPNISWMYAPKSTKYPETPLNSARGPIFGCHRDVLSGEKLRRTLWRVILRLFMITPALE